ncbi:MAG: Fe-S cluster assembly scaffold protein NifU [Methanomassiliicoccales archaeon]
MAYTQKVMDHFTNPRNMGEIADADGLGKVGNPTCGDMMYIYIKVKDDVITEIKFKTLGCAAAIATSSMVTELAKGMTLKQGLALTRKEVADALEGLPPQKMHCSNLAADGLHDAIRDYLVKNGRESEAPPKKEHDHDEHACETDAPIQIH